MDLLVTCTFFFFESYSLKFLAIFESAFLLLLLIKPSWLILNAA